ncbi:hypothetical protein JWH16_04310 [Xanthomonas campestris pv. campestris]|uniref:LPD29 domain-containing protein n=1 Tax=Xanthomonas campestris TaxID=339 RepID=UPI001E292A1C|nr:LPD29 domain-containing protein [Xanthomonas campestris]MCD0253078.1 hypothetical protein [Xanthomonas campestris pv. campestris]
MSQILAANSPIQIGQVIYTGLYCRGFGVVVKIHPRQSGVNFEIVFRSGQVSRQLPECILRGPQWKVYDEVVGESEIAELMANAVQYDMKKAKEAEDEAEAFAAGIAKLRVAPELAHLQQSSDALRGPKLAVKNIRADLKKHFPGIKFSVRSDYNQVRVQWVDGPTAAAVDALIRRYKAGSFNGMEDIYEFKSTEFGKVFGSIEYTFTSRDRSDQLVAHAFNETLQRFKHGIGGDVVPTLDGYLSGDLIHVPVAVGGVPANWLQELVSHVASRTDCSTGVMITPEDLR